MLVLPFLLRHIHCADWKCFLRHVNVWMLFKVVVVQSGSETLRYFAEMKLERDSENNGIRTSEW
jgi:hypothetical protein